MSYLSQPIQAQKFDAIINSYMPGTDNYRGSRQQQQQLPVSRRAKQANLNNNNNNNNFGGQGNFLSDAQQAPTGYGIPQGNILTGDPIGNNDNGLSPTLSGQGQLGQGQNFNGNGNNFNGLGNGANGFNGANTGNGFNGNGFNDNGFDGDSNGFDNGDLDRDFDGFNDGDLAMSSDEMNLKMLMSAVPGTPGQDYPIYSQVPETDFSCEGRIFGGKSEKQN